MGNIDFWPSNLLVVVAVSDAEHSSGEIVFDPDNHLGTTLEYSLKVSDGTPTNPTTRTREHNIYVAVIEDDPSLGDDRFDPADAEDAADYTSVNTAIDINLYSHAFHSPSTVMDRTFNVTQPDNGSLSAVNNGVVTYTPPTDFEGLAKFTWSFDAPHPNTVGQPTATSNTATFFIEVGRAVTVDLTAQGLTEAQEEQGSNAYLSLNDDYDSGTPLLDLEIVEAQWLKKMI